MWLCRTEGFVAYVYGTHVGIAADSASALTEGIDIYVSSDRYDASKSLGMVRLAGVTLKIVEHNLAVMPASRVLGLQRSTSEISKDNQKLFRDLWRDARPSALWRQSKMMDNMVALAPKPICGGMRHVIQWSDTRLRAKEETVCKT